MRKPGRILEWHLPQDACKGDSMPYRAVQFRAWCNGREIDTADLRRSASWKEAENSVKSSAQHKAFVAIERADPRMTLVRFYTVKKSTKKGFYREAHDGGPKVFVGALELVEVGDMMMRAFEPHRPFDALRDNPVNGRQSGDPVVIER